jgi:hypothetical protein
MHNAFYHTQHLKYTGVVRVALPTFEARTDGHDSQEQRACPTAVHLHRLNKSMISGDSTQADAEPVLVGSYLLLPLSWQARM